MGLFHLFASHSLLFLCLVAFGKCQYENIRCLCICTDGISVVRDNINVTRKVFIANVEKCNCKNAVLPQISGLLNDGKDKEFCSYCKCDMERRSTAIIKVVVVLIICIVTLLMIYMLFLMCLDPLLNKEGNKYEKHISEEEIIPMTRAVQCSTSSNVLDRVGQQQHLWKSQVQEQRRNIYYKHKMLN